MVMVDRLVVAFRTVIGLVGVVFRMAFVGARMAFVGYRTDELVVEVDLKSETVGDL